MGGGAPRELSAAVEVRDLDPDISKRLEAALSQLDGLSEEFKQSRIDESNAQLTKSWMDVNLIVAEHLRIVGISLINTHQIALESGTEGGGQGATPWCEEGGGALPRLEFRLVNGAIDAVSDDQVIAQGKVSRDIPIEWVEKVVIKWILVAVKAKTGG